MVLGMVTPSSNVCSRPDLFPVYQAIIYKSLWYSPSMAEILRFVCLVLNATDSFFGGLSGDRIGRKKQLGDFCHDQDLLLDQHLTASGLA